MKLNKRRVSVRWKIFGYLALFVGILLILLWLFQIVFLNNFYRAIKTTTIKKTANQIALSINDADISEKIINLSRQNDLCIRVLDRKFNDLYSAEIMPNCFIHHMPDSAILKYYNQARAKQGATLEIFTLDEFFEDTSMRHSKNNNMLPPFRRDNGGMIYIKLIADKAGNPYIILLNAKLSPLNATVNVLQIQLVYITVIFFILAILISFIIAKRVSIPIERINTSAKELACGNYNTKFCGEGYREISELNDTLNYAAKELSKVDLLRRELIANVSHDLRTPLTMITGYGEMMRDIPGENTPENVQIIIEEAKRLSDLVTDILDLSKLQAGSNELVRTQFNITEAVRDIVLRYSKFIENKGYTLEFIATEDVTINADELKISQVLYNLINNAIIYTGDTKKVTIEQKVIKNYVRIEVKDTGNGISKEQLPYVWERYYRTDKAHKREENGTGLGLSIVKAIFDLHGVNYGVISRVGNGSTFWFEFPIDKTE